MKIRNILALFLILLGLVQATGYIFNWPKVKGLGMTTVASPLPLVFTSFRGLETFSSQFTLRYKDASGKLHKEQLTPSLYEKFTGPYNRRNVYGAVIAYGTRLTEDNEKKLVNNVLHYGLCGKAPLMKAFGENEPVVWAEITVENKKGLEPFLEKLEVACNP